MRAILASLVTLAATLTPTVAAAGGVGLLTTGGLHQERIFFYDDAQEQYLQTQLRPNFGLGFEALLGDKDDRIIGVARAYWLGDSPPLAPTDPDVPDPIYAIPNTMESVGVFTVGVKWGIFGDPVGLQAHACGNVGGGVLTVDNQEYILAELGGGGQYQIGDHLQLYGDLLFAARYRKHLYPGMGAYAGVRYLFD